jgi:hypothetical protein
MIYGPSSPTDPIDQADIVDGCPLVYVADCDLDDLDRNQVEFVPTRVLVLTQTCDLANRKASAVTVAVALDAQFLVQQNLLKPSDIRGPIRAGRVFGWYFLPASGENRLPEMVVDLRQLHTVRLDLLTALCQRGQRRARLLTPYREHLAKHFADTYSRIGLPEPYDTQP